MVKMADSPMMRQSMATRPREGSVQACTAGEAADEMGMALIRISSPDRRDASDPTAGGGCALQDRRQSYTRAAAKAQPTRGSTRPRDRCRRACHGNTNG